MLAMMRVDGLGSPYFAGLILLLCGMGVLLPITGVEAGLLCLMVISGFLFDAAVVGGASVIRSVGTQLFFLSAAAGMSVASCVFLDVLRLNDFIERCAFEIGRDHLRKLDKAKSRFSANIHPELRTHFTLMRAPLDAMFSGE